MTLPTYEPREALRKRPVGFSLGHQRCSDLLFALWQVDPAQVQATLPAGLQVESYQAKHVDVEVFTLHEVQA